MNAAKIEVPVRKPGFLNARLLDRLEQIVVVALYAFLCWRLLPGAFAADHLFNLLVIISEGSVLVLVLLRRPTDQITVRPMEWGIAFTGTLAPLLVVGSGATFLPGTGVLLMTIGAIVHISAKLTLRRSFGIVAANRGLKTDGIYTVVRHPMYLGYLIVHLGFLIAVPSLWNAGVYALAWSCFVLRMMTEERVLSGNPDYVAYGARVRYRLIPGLW